MRCATLSSPTTSQARPADAEHLSLSPCGRRPIACDNAAYLVIDGGGVVVAFLNLPAEHFQVFRADLRLGPADVMLQLLDYELPVADDALDQITDRDDAEKLTTTDHRQVAHALGAHDCHAFLDRFVGLNEYNVAPHDFADQRLWRCATLQKHVAGVVPLGNDPDDLASVEHHQRADVLVGHHLDRVVHRVARMDGPYLMTLVIEDLTNCCHNRGQAGLLLASLQNPTPPAAVRSSAPGTTQRARFGRDD